MKTRSTKLNTCSLNHHTKLAPDYLGRFSPPAVALLPGLPAYQAQTLYLLVLHEQLASFLTHQLIQCLTTLSAAAVGTSPQRSCSGASQYRPRLTQLPEQREQPEHALGLRTTLARPEPAEEVAVNQADIAMNSIEDPVEESAIRDDDEGEVCPFCFFPFLSTFL